MTHGVQRAVCKPHSFVNHLRPRLHGKVHRSRHMSMQPARAALMDRASAFRRSPYAARNAGIGHLVRCWRTVPEGRLQKSSEFTACV
mgnify:CR=1 FL=1